MKTTEISINGEKYTMCFSMSALTEIYEKFGGLSEMMESITSGESPIESAEKTAAIADVGAILINAGARHAKLMGRECKVISGEKLMDSMDVHEIPKLVRAIFTTIKRDTNNEIELETESKNAEATTK